MAERNHWKHYKIHRQPVGLPTDQGIAWSYPWQVTRPSNHPLMQGDDWELFAYKQFDSFDNAIRWAYSESLRDKVRCRVDEFLEENMDTLVNVMIGVLL